MPNVPVLPRPGSHQLRGKRSIRNRLDQRHNNIRGHERKNKPRDKQQRDGGIPENIRLKGPGNQVQDQRTRKLLIYDIRNSHK